jgi:hypothetical protein
MVVHAHQVGRTVDVNPKCGSDGDSAQRITKADPELEEFKDGGRLANAGVLLQLEETGGGAEHREDREAGGFARSGDDEPGSALVRVQLQTWTLASLVWIVEECPVVNFSAAEATKARCVDVEVSRQEGKGRFVLEEGRNGLERAEGTTGPVWGSYGFDREVGGYRCEEGFDLVAEMSERDQDLGEPGCSDCVQQVAEERLIGGR